MSVDVPFTFRYKERPEAVLPTLSPGLTNDERARFTMAPKPYTANGRRCEVISIGDAVRDILLRCATHPDLSEAERQRRLAVVRETFPNG